MKTLPAVFKGLAKAFGSVPKLMFKGDDGRYYGVHGEDASMTKGDKVTLSVKGKKAVSYVR